MNKILSTIISVICLSVFTACGDGGSAVETVTNTITAEPIVGKWYPYESWLDDNNNNIEDKGEWHAFDGAYQKDLAALNMSIEDLAMTYKANGKGFISKIDADSTSFTWKNIGAGTYQSISKLDGELDTLTSTIGATGILTSTAVGLEKAIHWSKNIPK
jgi:hypothetical protein